MKTQTALQRAIEEVGSATALAGLLGITKGAVSQWKDIRRKVPADYCPSIERITEGTVTCEELRPDIDWAYLRTTQPTEKAL
jgi:DNA-binding transcriptional regulator YdaS (Cro superfamily)